MELESCSDFDITSFKIKIIIITNFDYVTERFKNVAEMFLKYS